MSMPQLRYPKRKHPEAFYPQDSQHKNQLRYIFSHALYSGLYFRPVLMELGLDSAVPHAIHLKLKAETGAIDNHLQCEVKVVKFHSPRRSEPCEKTSGYGIKVRR